MGQGEQWDSKHSRKNQQRNEVHHLLVKVLSMDVHCVCHKKVDFIPLLVFSRMLAVPLFPLSHCTLLFPIYMRPILLIKFVRKIGGQGFQADWKRYNDRTYSGARDQLLKTRLGTPRRV